MTRRSYMHLTKVTMHRMLLRKINEYELTQFEIEKLQKVNADLIKDNVDVKNQLVRFESSYDEVKRELKEARSEIGRQQSDRADMSIKLNIARGEKLTQQHNIDAYQDALNVIRRLMNQAEDD